MNKSEVIFKKAIVLKDKLEQLAYNVHQARISADKFIGQLDKPEEIDWGSAVNPSCSDMVSMANSVEKLSAVLNELVLQNYDEQMMLPKFAKL